MQLFTSLGRSISLAFLLVFSLVSYAGSNNDPTGNWQTIDSKSKKPSSIISIWQSKSKFYGRVTKIYSVNGARVNDICSKCQGNQHNKPMLGLTIIRDMVAQQKNKYAKGWILDPRNGNVYHCEFKLSAKGDKLFVRGYIGIPLFGRTDVWRRLETAS